MRQTRSSKTTRYEAVKEPAVSDGYPQRIKMWQAVERLGTANRLELLAELERTEYARPNGARLDETYCRIELTDMTKRGFLRRITD